MSDTFYGSEGVYIIIFSKWVRFLLQQTINFFPYIICVCTTKQSLEDGFFIHILFLSEEVAKT